MTGPLINKTNKRRKILIGMCKLLNDTGRSKKKRWSIGHNETKSGTLSWDLLQKNVGISGKNAKVCGSSFGVFSSLRFCRSLLRRFAEMGSAALKNKIQISIFNFFNNTYMICMTILLPIKKYNISCHWHIRFIFPSVIFLIPIFSICT